MEKGCHISLNIVSSRRTYDGLHKTGRRHERLKATVVFIGRALLPGRLKICIVCLCSPLKEAMLYPHKQCRMGTLLQASE